MTLSVRDWWSSISFLNCLKRIKKKEKRKMFHYYHFVKVIKNDPLFSSWIPL